MTDDTKNPEPLIVLATQTQTDEIRGYKESKWHQWTNYECLFCQYSTLFQDKIVKHMDEGEHVWAFPSGVEVPEEPESGDPTY